MKIEMIFLDDTTKILTLDIYTLLLRTLSDCTLQGLGKHIRTREHIANSSKRRQYTKPKSSVLGLIFFGRWIFLLGVARRFRFGAWPKVSEVPRGTSEQDVL